MLCPVLSDVSSNMGAYSITGSLLRCQLECKSFVFVLV